MAIVSHTHRFIFLATNKTASSSVEASLWRYVTPRDWVRVTTDIGPIDHPFFRTAQRTTTWFPHEPAFKSGLSRTGLFQPLRLQKHSTAALVRDIVGDDRWDDYVKIVVERNPWDRFISLWRWASRHDRRSLDDFIGEAEALARIAPPARARPRRFPHTPEKHQWWTTWPIYTIDDEIAVDHVVRYENLADDLHDALAHAGIDWDRWMPRLKSQYRPVVDRPSTLTVGQIERIGALCHREIAAHGYEPPYTSPRTACG
jgi:hypothetical protein